jgi:hypothetical protein
VTNRQHQDVDVLLRHRGTDTVEAVTVDIGSGECSHPPSVPRGAGIAPVASASGARCVEGR